MKRSHFLFLSLIILIVNCKKPYLPSVINAPGSYLVVEGIINSGSDSTIIKLSRTVGLTKTTPLNPLTKAILTVESDRNNLYPLKETSGGTYVSSGLNLDNSRNYRLRISAADGKQYVSDFVPVLVAPPIDSINYSIADNGLNIYSNTHDPKNNTHYYRWDYQETWIFHSNFDSFFKSDGTTILPRDVINDNIFECWRTNVSNTIILSSTAKLSHDVVVNNPITFIPASSEKISIKYSILVRQYALTKDAYVFWENLKKNTEQLGSIFDAQPTQSISNIHSITTPSEPVVGYISVGAFSSHRIFISNRQLPIWVTAPAYPGCKLDTFLYKYVAPGTKDPVNQVKIYLINKSGVSGSFLPVNAISIPGMPIPLGYSGAPPECVDCTLRGTNKPPAFWK